MNCSRFQILGLAVVLCFSIELALTPPARSESDLRIPYPEEFGVIPAGTYDETGHRIGAAALNVDRADDGGVSLTVQSGFDGGAQQIVRADFEAYEFEGKTVLRLLRERSQSFDPDGKPLVILEIDHQLGKASCTPPDGSKSASDTIDLPEQDRVANVPLNLLFTPLVQREIEKLETQVFFCLGGARLMQFAARAVAVPSKEGSDEPAMLKVIYEPNVNLLFNWAAKALAPKILFWFDSGKSEPRRYLGHRLPLYTNGPVVYVIRDGVSPKALVESAASESTDD
jgi:hypothetical protein